MLGALVVATTSLVSCKDYDDEVQDLQTQINSLQTLVNTKEASINSTISTMQGTLNNLMGLEALLTGKISDGDAATLAAAKLAVAEAKAALEAAIAAGNAATLATAQQNLADAKAALEAAIASGDTATLAAAQKAVADATAALERALAAGDAATLAAAQKAVEDATAKLEAAIKSGDEAAIAAAQKAVADATAKLEAAFKAGDSETLAAAQKAVDDAKAKLEAAIKSGDEAAVAAAQKALDAATAKLEAAIKAGDDATLAAARKELADAKAALEAAIKSGDAATLAAAKDALAEVKSALEKAIAEGDAATLAAAKAALAEVKAELEAAIKSGDASTLATALDELNKASTELSAAIAKNAADIKKNADDIQTLVGQLADQDAAIKKAQADLAQALIQLEELGSRLGKLEGIVDLAVVDIETIKGQIRKAESEIEQIKNRLNTLEQNYTVLNDKVADALKDIEELWVAVKAQADVLAALGGGQDADAITEALKLLERLSSLENQVEYLIGDNAREVASRLDDHDVTLGELRAEFANYTKADEFEGLKANFTELEGKVNELEGNLSSLGSKVNTLAAALAKALRSLVFQPSLYVDGIESIEYPYIADTTLVIETSSRAINRPARTTEGFVDGGKKVIEATGKGLAPLRDWIRNNSSTSRFYGPAWPVDYHMNPSKSHPKWADVKGWNLREAEVITRSTNAAKNILITDKYVDGTDLFNVANGTITVGLQVKDPGLLAHHANPTEADGRPGNLQENGVRSNSPVYDDLLALQVYSDGDIEGEEKKVITSDYAMIYPEKVWPEAIIWNHKPNKLYKNTINFDEQCPYDGKVHVWKSPYDALGCNDASVYPDIELQWDDTEGIRLGDYLGIHYVRDCKTKSAKVPGTWAYGEESKWGYYYEFQRVGYSIDGNITVDSKYALFKDEDANGVSKNGVIEAWNVDDKGNTIKEKSMTSVDREPLVRVLVKRMADNQVVLDGYILIHITRKAADVPPGEKLEIDNLPTGSVTFNTCDAEKALEINWSQFSYFVLTQKMENMTKEDFDAQYGKDYQGVPDLKVAGATGTQAQGSDDLYFDLQIYDNMNGKKANDYSGTVTYRYNAVGTTNHTFTWTLSEEDLEYWTHDKTSLPVTLTKYIRYTKRSGAAKYDYVYVKLVAKLDRVKQSTGIQSKNTNYWFSTAAATLGADNGFDAIFFNSQFPQDGNVAFQAPAVFTNDIYNTFVQNKVDFTLTSVFSAYNALAYNKRERNETAKFYFVPEETTITTQAGVTYTITPRPNASDQKWNAFVCKYGFHQYPYQAHKWSTPAENKKILQNCAIDYNDGVFTNNKLYAVNNGTYTHIATLDQNITTGTVELVFRNPDNDVTKEILNAIGYTADHKNVLTEFHTKVGVVGHNNCGVAIYVDEMETGKDNSKAGTFWVSWQRPINVDTHEKDMVDAKNNGDYVYLVDMLQMYDWRGPVEGKMYGANQWLWAFYNVKSVKIDVTPSKVKTNMHQSNVNTFKPLSQITTRARLRALDASGNAAQTATIVFADNLPSYPTAYNMASMNDKLNEDLGLVPADVAKKALFGGLYYENNGENVEKFDVIVPIEINYGWGRFLASVKVRIDRTLGN